MVKTLPWVSIFPSCRGQGRLLPGSSRPCSLLPRKLCSQSER